MHARQSPCLPARAREWRGWQPPRPRPGATHCPCPCPCRAEPMRGRAPAGQGAGRRRGRPHPAHARRYLLPLLVLLTSLTRPLLPPSAGPLLLVMREPVLGRLPSRWAPFPDLLCSRSSSLSRWWKSRSFRSKSCGRGGGSEGGWT